MSDATFSLVFCCLSKKIIDFFEKSFSWSWFDYLMLNLMILPLAKKFHWLWLRHCSLFFIIKIDWFDDQCNARGWDPWRGWNWGPVWTGQFDCLFWSYHDLLPKTLLLSMIKFNEFFLIILRLSIYTLRKKNFSNFEW